MSSNLIDLSRIEPPAAVEKLSYETILDEMVSDLKARYSDFSALVESDPAYKVLEVCAYREVMLRQRINDGAKAVMLAYASGSDLDNLGALFNLSRLCIDKGNDTLVPPVPPLWEPDPAFRKRILLVLEGITTAGSEDSYIFHSLNAHASVKDVSVQSPNPGEVLITILGHSGVPDQTVLDIVKNALNAEKSVR